MTVSKTLMRKSFMIGARYTGLTRLVEPLLRGNGAILMLHRVGKQQNLSGINRFLSIDGGFLHDLIGALKADGYIFVSMDEAVDRLVSGHKDERYLTITLDDGYRDNMLTAAPIFTKHEVPYMIYACTGFCSEQAFLWWEIVAQILDKNDQVIVPLPDGELTIDCLTPRQKRSAYESLTDYFCTKVDEHRQREIVAQLAQNYKVDVMAHCRKAVMSWNELRKIANDPLCSIGAHTINHYHMARLGFDEALHEARHSADILERELGERPAHFAYPYGGTIAAGERETGIVKQAGFLSAVTTRHGLLHDRHAQNLHALPRVSINGEYQRAHYVRTMLSGITVPAANRGSKFVTMNGS